VIVSPPRMTQDRHQQRLPMVVPERPLGNHGHVRTLIGDLVEDMSAALLGGVRHKCSSQADYCPDVSVDLPHGRVFVECKAAGRNRETFIYEGRLEKDRLFTADRPLFYCVVHHGTDTTQADTVEDLQRRFFRNLRCLYLVPFEVIDGLCRGREPEALNSGYGGTDRKTYGSGFRLKLRDFEPWLLMDFAQW